MDAACSRRTGRWQIAPRSLKKADDRRDDFGLAVGDDVRPTLGIIAWKNVYLRARKLFGRASTRLGAQTRLPRDHEEARRDMRKRPRVEPRWCTEYKSGDTLGKLRRKIGNVARDLCGKACCIELEVLHQRGEPLNGFHSSLPSHRRPGEHVQMRSWRGQRDSR